MIKPATIRDATYVTANLRPEDQMESDVQLGPLHPIDLGAAMVQQPYAFIAYHDDVPAVIFGATPISVTTVSAWALGTKHMRRAIPSVTRFCLGPLSGQLNRDGYRWAEARVLLTNELAVRWMKTMKAKNVATLPRYGSGGEPFGLFRRKLLPYAVPKQL